jgi:hypothetical protein
VPQENGISKILNIQDRFHCYLEMTTSAFRRELDLTLHTPVMLKEVRLAVVILIINSAAHALATPNNVKPQIIVKHGTIQIVIMATVSTGPGVVNVKVTPITCSKCAHSHAETKTPTQMMIARLGMMRTATKEIANFGLT